MIDTDHPLTKTLRLGRFTRQGKHNCEHLLFVTPKGNSYVGNRRGNAVWQEYQKAVDAAGVTGRTFYDCRRTFASVAES